MAWLVVVAHEWVCSFPFLLLEMEEQDFRVCVEFHCSRFSREIIRRFFFFFSFLPMVWLYYIGSRLLIASLESNSCHLPH